MNRPESGDRLDTPWYRTGRHWVSAVNYDPQVQAQYSFARPLTIFDSTLRKILYVPGLRPSLDDLLHIAGALEEVGIREVLLNVHWWGNAEPESMEYDLCRAVLARDFAFRTTVCWDLPSPDDVGYHPVPDREAVDTLRAIGMQTFSVSLRVAKEVDAREAQLERLAQVFAYAQSLGLDCALSLNDAGRTDFEFLLRAANEGIRLGAIRVDLSESYSSLSPEAMKLFVTRFRAGLQEPVPSIMHTHDDFGLASACAIAAATVGAHPDVAVNGVSYRAGFAALEEVVVALEVLYGVETGIRLDRLQWLSDTVAERMGLPKHPLKAISGSHAYTLDFPTWMIKHLKGGPEGFPPPASCLAPSVVGARTRLVWGFHHSDPVIRAKLHQMGLEGAAGQVQEIRRRIEEALESRDRYPAWVTEEEVEEMCRAVVTGDSTASRG